MGILDSVLGGGSQSTSSHLPGYIEDPSKAIGYRVNQLVGMPGQQGFNPRQTQAIDTLWGEATSGNPFAQGAEQFIAGTFENGGLNQQQDWLANQLIGGGFVNPAAAETQRVAMGGDVGSNPWLDQTYDRAANVMGQQFQDNAIAGMDSSFAANGRLGSGAYARARNTAEDAFGRQLNDLAGQIYGGAYQSDMARKDAALGQLAGLGQQDVENRLAGSGVYQGGVGNQFNALSGMGAADDARYSDAERMFQIGNTVQQQPWQSLNLGSGIIGRLPYPQSTMTQSNPNAFGQLMGLGTAIGGFGTAGGGTVGGDLFTKMFG